MARKKHIKLAVPKLEGWNHAIHSDNEEITIFFSTAAGTATILLPKSEGGVLGAMLVIEAHKEG